MADGFDFRELTKFEKDLLETAQDFKNGKHTKQFLRKQGTELNKTNKKQAKTSGINIKSKLSDLGKVMWEFAGKQIIFVIDTLKRFGSIIWNMIIQVIDAIKPLVPTILNLFSKIVKVVSFLVIALSPVLGFIIGVFVTKIIYSFMLVANKIKAVITMVAGVLNGLLTILSGVIDFLVGIFTGNWTMAWEGILSIIDGVIGVIKSLWQGLVDWLTAPVDAVVNILDGVFKDKVEGLKKVWEDLKNVFKNPIKAVVNLFKRDKTGGVDGSHKTGLARVPFDGYLAELHKGERVLTKDESNNYRNDTNGARSYGTSISNMSRVDNTDSNITIIIQGNVYGEEDFVNRVGTALNKKVDLVLANMP